MWLILLTTLAGMELVEEEGVLRKLPRAEFRWPEREEREEGPVLSDSWLRSV